MATTFYYADDMNCEKTREEVHNLFICDEVDKEFCPLQAQWVNCKATTHYPHINECRPRAPIVHPLVMAMHPMSSCEMLRPMMHPNLVEITRAFVAKTIAQGACYRGAFNEFLTNDKEHANEQLEMKGIGRNKPLLDVTDTRTIDLSNVYNKEQKLESTLTNQ